VSGFHDEMMAKRAYDTLQSRSGKLGSPPFELLPAREQGAWIEVVGMLHSCPGRATTCPRCSRNRLRRMAAKAKKRAAGGMSAGGGV